MRASPALPRPAQLNVPLLVTQLSFLCLWSVGTRDRCVARHETTPPPPLPQVCGPLPEDSVSSLPDGHPGRAALSEAHCAFIESWTRFLIVTAQLHVSC